MKKIPHLRQRICACLFVLCVMLFLCGCGVNWVTEISGAINAFGPSLLAFFGLLTAFGAKIPANVLTEATSIESGIVNDLNNVVLPLIQQYNAAEADAKPGILGQIQSAIASCTTNMGKIASVFAQANLDPSVAAKVSAILQALTVQLNAIAAFLPVVEGDANSVKEAVKTGNIPLNSEQWTTHYNQVLRHATGTPETDAAIASLPALAVPAPQR